MTFKAMKFKVENEAHSEAIQRELFKQGYQWRSGDCSVLHTGCKVLSTWYNGTLSFGFNLDDGCLSDHDLTTLEQLQESAKMTTPRTAPLHWPANEPFPYKHLEGRSVVCTRNEGLYQYKKGCTYIIGEDGHDDFGPLDEDEETPSVNHENYYAFDLILNDDEDGVPAAPEQDIYTTSAEDCTGAITIGFETPATPHDLVAKAFNLVSGYNLSSDDVALILQLAKRS